MTKISDYEKEDGNIDWPAYNKAQKEVGDICYQCCNLILKYSNTPTKPSLCFACKQLSESQMGVFHQTYVRCPKCKHFQDPYNHPTNYYTDGLDDYPIECEECGKIYNVRAHVTVTFESPEMLEEGETENEL